MKPPKLGSFAERQANSAEAKKALVAKFKPKPTVVDPEFEERRLQRQLEQASESSPRVTSPVRELRKQVGEFKRVLAEKTLEADFSKAPCKKSRLGARAARALSDLTRLDGGLLLSSRQSHFPNRQSRSIRTTSNIKSGRRRHSRMLAVILWKQSR